MSITTKELLPIIVVVAIWGPFWRGASALYHCDDEVVVAAVKRRLQGSYTRPNVAMLVFLEAKYDASLSAVHVPGIENRVADSILRNNLLLLFNLPPQAQPNTCRVPDGLVSHLIRERSWTSSTWLGTLLMTH